MPRIIYAGTPEFAVPALTALLREGCNIVAVYTQPDRPAGRGRKLQQSPVKQAAVAAGLPVFQPENFRAPEDLRQLESFAADLMVVAAYGLLLPPAVLAAPRLCCVNIHASLLPRWRGASPIQQAILAGDSESGVTLMKMDRGLDTGAVISRRAIALDADWSAAELHDALAPLGAELLLEALPDIEQRIAAAEPQDESAATYAPRLNKQQALVDWTKTATELSREIRAYNPWPVSFTYLHKDNLRLWQARASSAYSEREPGRVVAHDRSGVYVSCGEGVLQVTELQLAGRKRWNAGQALNAGNLSDQVLGDAG